MANDAKGKASDYAESNAHYSFEAYFVTTLMVIADRLLCLHHCALESCTETSEGAVAKNGTALVFTVHILRRNLVHKV